MKRPAQSRGIGILPCEQQRYRLFRGTVTIKGGEVSTSTHEKFVVLLRGMKLDEKDLPTTAGVN